MNRLPIKTIISAIFLILSFTILAPNFGCPVLAVDPPTPQAAALPAPTPGQWVEDEDVTFAGKNVNRAQELLDWTLKNYKWSEVTVGQENPLAKAHATIRSISFAILTLFILAAAFMLILTRGQNITLMRFIPRFLVAVLLIAFAFYLIQFIYQITDIIQGFFLQSSNPACTAKIICRADLLNIDFDYRKFIGYRKFGLEYDESAFLSTLMVKLTALTYYAMSAILIVRKVVLWFFIILSPVLPLLLIFAPIRNTAKYWIGEFFRWLLYAPLLAILLSGLVVIWKGGDITNRDPKTTIPLNFNYENLEGRAKETEAVTPENKQSYYTAINILLGGPKQAVSENNNLNTVDTFAQYVISLVMLWLVILLPFVLLKIFLDYVTNIALNNDSALVNYISSRANPLMNRYGFGGSNPPPPPPSSIKPTGSALSLPVFNRSNALENFEEYGSVANESSANISANVAAGVERAIEQNIADRANLQSTVSSGERANAFSSSALGSRVSNQTFNQYSTNISNNNINEADRQILELTNLSIPTMQDIVRYETQILSNDNQAKYQLNQITESLRRLSSSSAIMSSKEREQYSRVRDSVSAQAQQGSAVAASIIKASVATTSGGGIAANTGTTSVHVSNTALPSTNKIQQVNIEDYEIVKKMWEENFKKLEPPKGADGKEISRKGWINEEKKKVEEAINLLLSPDPQNQKKGQELVGKILPFLLLGGFSKEEIVSYLKAKQAAANETLEQLKTLDEEEDSKLPAQTKPVEQPKVMQAEVEEKR